MVSHWLCKLIFLWSSYVPLDRVTDVSFCSADIRKLFVISHADHYTARPLICTSASIFCSAAVKPANVAWPTVLWAPCLSLDSSWDEMGFVHVLAASLGSKYCSVPSVCTWCSPVRCLWLSAAHCFGYQFNKNVKIIMYLITAWSRIRLEKLPVAHVTRKFPSFDGTRRGSLPFAQMLATSPHPEPDESCWHPPTLFL